MLTVFLFDSSLSSLTSKLEEKQEELRRLREIKPKLDLLTAEFSLNISACSEPSLAKDTWKGNKANSFNEYRKANVLENYNLILNEQFPVIYQSLQLKEEKIMGEISDLQKEISLEKARIKEEKEAKALKGK